MRISDWSSDVCSSDLRFACARPADHAQNLAPPHLQVQLLVDHLFAECVVQPLDADDDILARHAQPISVKNTAKKASSTITMKMPCTTAAVVRRPTSSALPFTCMP